MTAPRPDTKAEWRATAKMRRKAVPEGDQAYAVISHFTGAMATKSGDAVALYRAVHDEIDPAPLARMLRTMGVLCAYPVTQPPSRIMSFALWQDGDALMRGPFQIEQPVEDAPRTTPQIVVMPLLAWDDNGTRLGYGGGYYDATLHALRLHSPVLAVGLAFDEQYSPLALPSEAHDIPLDWIVTPSGARCFNR
jgi:5-formyltetrahydrofolate cyclo-ligase